MNNRQTNPFRFIFGLIDVLSLNLVHLILLYLVNSLPEGNQYAYVLLFFATNMSWIICSYLTALYINDDQLDVESFAKRSVQTFLLFLISLLLFIFLYDYSYSRLYVMLGLGTFGLVLLISRTILILSVNYINNKERYIRKVVVLGYNDISKKLVDYFSSKNRSVSVEGVFEDYNQITELSVLPILGMQNECVPFAINNQITEIYCTISPEKYSHIYEVAQFAEKNLIRFKFVPDFRMFVNRKIHIDFLRDIPVLSFRSEPLEDIGCRTKKRLFDIIFSFLVTILLLSWLVPLIALLIKLDSRGPVFFVQKRSGKNNKSFSCIKFRSLMVNGNADKQQVTRNDDRFTRLGKFLRKSNLDELPQFFNVLQGNMSVVGPRPHMLKHTQDYSRILNQYMIRHFVKPGVTGWAQVHGYRGEIKEEKQLRKRIEYDIWYLENWSLWLDMRIVFLTVYTTFKGDKNAY